MTNNFCLHDPITEAAKVKEGIEETPRKKGFDVCWEEGRIHEESRELIAELPGVPPLVTLHLFLVSRSYHLATLYDRGRRTVAKRGGVRDPPLPNGKVLKAKQNGQTVCNCIPSFHLSIAPAGSE